MGICLSWIRHFQSLMPLYSQFMFILSIDAVIINNRHVSCSYFINRLPPIGIPQRDDVVHFVCRIRTRLCIVCWKVKEKSQSKIQEYLHFLVLVSNFKSLLMVSDGFIVPTELFFVVLVTG